MKFVIEKRLKSNHWRRVALRTGMMAIVCICAVLPIRVAYAENEDPFAMDAAVWKSFDRYKEEQKEKLISNATGDLDKDSQAIAAADQKAEQDKALAKIAPPPAPSVVAAPEKITATASAPVLAPPDRPINEAVLPGLTTPKVVISSDAEQQRDAAAHPINADPDVQTSKNDWKDAAKAAQQHAEGKDNDVASAPINVRLTMLPALAAPVVQKKAPPVAPPKQIASVVAPTVTPSPPMPAPNLARAQPVAADPAACAAVDAYKKHELEAIQSDRSTLAALQSAISELGLNKQLSYMTNTNGSTLSSSNTASSGSAPPAP